MKHFILIGSFAICLVGSAVSSRGDDLPKNELPEAVTTSELAQMSGGALPRTVAVTTQDLSASNSNNTVNANSITTGDISLPTNAFSGYNGVGNFVFNTGNNNNVQGSLSITIVTPAN